MSTVQPIRDIKKIDAMKKFLLGQNIRDYTLFTLGINSGLRISDLLALKLGDVYHREKLVQEIRVKEKKTGKYKSFPLGKKTKKALLDYIQSVEDFQLDDPLFFSRKREGGKRRPITRQHAHYIFSEAAEYVGIMDKIGTHTLRKTFGYFAYKNGTDLSLLQDIFNHASPQITLRYIGITKEQRDNVYISLDL